MLRLNFGFSLSNYASSILPMVVAKNTVSV